MTGSLPAVLGSTKPDRKLAEMELDMVDERSAWRDVALDLPRLHTEIAAGRAEHAVERFADLPDLDGAALESVEFEGSAADADLEATSLREHVLDVLMVEAFARRHAEVFDPEILDRIGRAARRSADRLGMRPIISYPLYIRANSMEPEAMRRFTPLAAETRFIRMHRFIEDRFDELIELLREITQSPDPGRAFSEHQPEIGVAFRQINRVMAGFRDPIRMPNHDFTHGFRPYFQSVLHPETGAVLIDGPSGLQSPTFRVIAMLTGYEDPVLDDWTRRIAEYHDPETRAQLANALDARAAGRSLGRSIESVLGAGPAWPHIHPDYGAHIPDLIRLARHGGYLGDGVEAVFAEHGISLEHWPAETVGHPALPTVDDPPELTDSLICALGPYVELEAMLFGFHVEHVAVAAAQIGHERGTGGTSGVEFLQMALFRRAFPWLWVSGAARRIVARAVGA